MDGNFNFEVLRSAGVPLMYAEAMNETQRWLDPGRQHHFAPLAELNAHDPDSNFSEPPWSMSMSLPIPLDEVTQNPNVRPHPGP